MADEDEEQQEEEIMVSRIATPQGPEPIPSKLFSIIFCSNQVKTKLKFPILTGKLIQQAITENELHHDQKDTLIRNPNIHTILQIKLDVDSPRLQEAMKIKKLEIKDLKVHDYEDTYDSQKKPLNNLISYIKYITTQYNVLTDLLRTRNLLKLKERKNKKLFGSKDMKSLEIKSQQFSQYDQSANESSRMILTEVPQSSSMQPKFTNLSPSKFQRDESSFFKDRSLLSLGNQTSILGRSIMSQDQRKNVFDKKTELEEKHLSKFYQEALIQIQNKEQFYSQLLPQTNTRVDKIKQDHIENIQTKMNKSNKKVVVVQQKNIIKKEELLIKYDEKVVRIEENIQKHTDKKNQLRNDQITSAGEQKKHQGQLDEERDERRHYYQKEEDQMINGIIDRLEVKTVLLQENIEKKKLSEDTRKRKLHKRLKNKQLKVLTEIKTAEFETMKDYLERQSDRQNQLMNHDNRISQYKQDMSTRNSNQLKKVEQQYQQIQEKQLNILERQMEMQQEKTDGVLERHLSLIELRKVKLVEKNQIRQHLTKVNNFNNLLTQKKNNDSMLRKFKENTHRYETSKQEQEDFQQYRMDKMQEIGQKRFDQLNSAKF